MIDNLQDTLTENINQVNDTNNELHTRVKQYQMINRYFDNFLRFNKKMVAFDFVRYYLIFVLIGLINYNLFVYDNLTFKTLIEIMSNQILDLLAFVQEYLINSHGSKINALIEQLEIGHYLKFYPLQKVDLTKDIEIPFLFTIYLYLLIGLLVFYYLIVIYKYYSQKHLFAASITFMHIPIIFLYSFYKREKGFFYLKLIKHQKNKNIFPTMSKMIISNLFDLELDPNAKVEIIFTPRKLFYFYDYIEVSYIIDKKSSKQFFNENIENKLDEIKENIDNSNSKELEFLDLEALDKMQI